jgi:urease alpha subunit
MRPMFAVSPTLLPMRSPYQKTNHLSILPQPLVPRTSITFVSALSISTGTVTKYGLHKRIEAVKNCRKIGKKDMKYNDVMPKMKVDPESYVSLPAL